MDTHCPELAGASNIESHQKPAAQCVASVEHNVAVCYWTLTIMARLRSKVPIDVARGPTCRN